MKKYNNHSHSNRYTYVTNKDNKTYNSLKEFMLDEGMPEDHATTHSSRFYHNLVGEDGLPIEIGSGHHGALASEFMWKNPETAEVLTVRRLKRFRSNERI